MHIRVHHWRVRLGIQVIHEHSRPIAAVRLAIWPTPTHIRQMQSWCHVRVCKEAVCRKWMHMSKDINILYNQNISIFFFDCICCYRFHWYSCIFWIVLWTKQQTSYLRHEKRLLLSTRYHWVKHQYIFLHIQVFILSLSHSEMYKQIGLPTSR